jgi:hypothetical protein
MTVMAVDEAVIGEQSSGSEGYTPPYIPWATFQGLLTRMETTVVPTKIDYSFLTNYAGGERPKIVQALRYLGLVDRDSFRATDELKELVAKKDERPRLFRKLLETHYPWALNLPTNSTEQELLDAFHANGGNVDGETRRKAVTFFLNAAEAAQVEVSQLWRRGRGRPAGVTRRGKRKGQAKGDPPPPPPPEETGSGSRGQASLGGKTLDPTIDAWVRRLPEPGSTWALAKKNHWFKTFRNIVDGVYPESDEEAG